MPVFGPYLPLATVTNIPFVTVVALVAIVVPPFVSPSSRERMLGKPIVLASTPLAPLPMPSCSLHSLFPRLYMPTHYHKPLVARSSNSDTSDPAFGLQNLLHRQKFPDASSCISVSVPADREAPSHPPYQPSPHLHLPLHHPLSVQCIGSCFLVHPRLCEDDQKP
ncbi:hypothetical protein HanRHA438_Chr10g0471131 [Helianthus annuus]|nr:hypothetical protein HanRHA438_Chr10g0471131 [Helianthus annuus]